MHKKLYVLHVLNDNITFSVTERLWKIVLTMSISQKKNAKSKNLTVRTKEVKPSENLWAANPLVTNHEKQGLPVSG